MSKKNRQSKNRGVKFVVFLTVLIAVTMGSFILSYQYAIESGLNSEDVIINIDPDHGIYVEVPLGASTNTIVNILKEKGLIRSPLMFKLLSMLNGYDGMYKSGTHILSRDLEYEDMMRVLSDNPVSVKVRFREGSTINQVVDELYDKKLITDKKAFYTTANTEKFDYKFLQTIPERENRLEGYLFPDTYEFGLKSSEKDILQVMLNNFNYRFEPDYYDKAKKLNLTVDQVITVASIIEKEASDSKERSIIAQVLYNRMSNKDKNLRKLQSCATIQYVFFNRITDISEEDKKRIAEGKILDKDTAVDDPYNTYKYEGLPPGPICSPSKISIEAALNPDPEAKEKGYLYFVATGDGSHVFSSSYAEHEANRKKYEKK